VLPIHELFIKRDAATIGELNPSGPVSDPVTDPVSDPVDPKVLSLLNVLANAPETAAGLRTALSVSHRKFFRDNYINPAFRAGLIIPEKGLSPHNPHLRYFITERGLGLVRLNGGRRR
jgi:hypothetical protein